MRSIELKARAKINLSLDVTRKRSDGYHDVKMIMQTIELHDRVTLDSTDAGIEITSNCPWVPNNSENIAYKAADLFIKEFDLRCGIRINIDKRIPVAAGLAGGSTDAAAVLKGINQMFSLGIDEQQLMKLGKQIGADVPYCIRGGTMLSEGIGEILTELSPLPRTSIVLVKPRIGVSTAWVYKNLDLGKIADRPDTELLTKAISDRNIDILAKNMKNVLESVTIPKYKIIFDIKDALTGLGASGSMMSGSGPTVFGIFRDQKTAQEAYLAMKKHKYECYLTETV